MNVLERTQDLVEEVLAMIVCEWLRRANYLVQIGVHELRHDVHVFKLVWSNRRQDVPDANHILMIEMAQDLHLA